MVLPLRGRRRSINKRTLTTERNYARAIIRTACDAGTKESLLAILTDSEAADFVRLLLDSLERTEARDVITGIDESRRLGIEEPVQEVPGQEQRWSKAELREVGAVRRRPPTDAELLSLILERIEQRLLVLPAIARTLKNHLRHADIVWRVDSAFVPVDRSSTLEANVSELLPPGIDDVAAAFERIRNIIPDLVPRTPRRG